MKTKLIHPQNVAQAAKIIKQGNICAIPTETVYGLGADASNIDAVLNIYQTKNRPRFNPLIVHCANMSMAENLVEFSPLALKLTKFWAGALTLVLPLKENAPIADIVSAGLDTLAVRIPAHPLTHELIKILGFPIAAPSANPSGKLSPTNAQMVKDSFNNSVPVLDGGECSAGLESTILAIENDKVIQLRAGAIAKQEIEKTIGIKINNAKEGDAISAPGMLKSHYSPNAKIRLNAKSPKANEAYLAFGETPYFKGEVKNLSQTRNLKEAAKNLFSYLNQLDKTGIKTIAIAPIPNEGLGEAINDRLKRAATPR
jgi:L-threonylcarbamoyladenylate synthase